MKPVCEIVATQLLPTMRAMIAKELMEQHGMNQQEAAECLGLSQPAISQYTRDLRGSKVKILTKEKDVYLKITEIGNKLAEDKIDKDQLVSEFCDVCRLIRRKGLVCELHKKVYPIKECKICLK